MKAWKLIKMISIVIVVLIPTSNSLSIENSLIPSPVVLKEKKFYLKCQDGSYEIYKVLSANKETFVLEQITSYGIFHIGKSQWMRNSILRNYKKFKGVFIYKNRFNNIENFALLEDKGTMNIVFIQNVDEKDVTQTYTITRNLKENSIFVKEELNGGEEHESIQSTFSRDPFRLLESNWKVDGIDHVCREILDISFFQKLKLYALAYLRTYIYHH